MVKRVSRGDLDDVDRGTSKLSASFGRSFPHCSAAASFSPSKSLILALHRSIFLHRTFYSILPPPPHRQPSSVDSRPNSCPRGMPSNSRKSKSRALCNLTLVDARLSRRRRRRKRGNERNLFPICQSFKFHVRPQPRKKNENKLRKMKLSSHWTELYKI